MLATRPYATAAPDLLELEQIALLDARDTPDGILGARLVGLGRNLTGRERCSASTRRVHALKRSRRGGCCFGGPAGVPPAAGERTFCGSVRAVGGRRPARGQRAPEQHRQLAGDGEDRFAVLVSGLGALGLAGLAVWSSPRYATRLGSS